MTPHTRRRHAALLLLCALVVTGCASRDQSAAPHPAAPPVPVGQPAVPVVQMTTPAFATPAPPATTAPVAAAPVAAAPDAFQVSPDVVPPSPKIPTGFVALSVESQSIADGSFSADTPGLVALLRGLHPGFLRIGANTGDSAPLTTAQLTTLARLAAAVPVPVVLQLPLRPDKPQPAATEAVTASQLLGSRLAALEIGNEPDGYGITGIRRKPWTYAAFVKQRDGYRLALRTAGVTTPLWGPSDSGSQWLGTTVAEHERPYAAITQHFYPLSNCRPPTPTIRGLLSDDILATEQGEAALMSRAIVASRLPVVIDETNSVSCYGGTEGVSNTSASALWALDYGLVMARAGVAALAFHVPLSGCAGYSPMCLVGTGSARHWVASPEYDGLATLATLTGDSFAAGSLTSVHHHLRTYALTTATGSPVLVALDLDPAARGATLLSWRHSAASAAITQTQFGSAHYESRTTPPIQAALTAAPVTSDGTSVTQLLTMTPGTASVFAP